jgi:hypothetical protein
VTHYTSTIDNHSHMREQLRESSIHEGLIIREQLTVKQLFMRRRSTTLAIVHEQLTQASPVDDCMSTVACMRFLLYII